MEGEVIGIEGWRQKGWNQKVNKGEEGVFYVSYCVSYGLMPMSVLCGFSP